MGEKRTARGEGRREEKRREEGCVTAGDRATEEAGYGEAVRETKRGEERTTERGRRRERATEKGRERESESGSSCHGVSVGAAPGRRSIFPDFSARRGKYLLESAAGEHAASRADSSVVVVVAVAVIAVVVVPLFVVLFVIVIDIPETTTRVARSPFTCAHVCLGLRSHVKLSGTSARARTFTERPPCVHIYV